VASLGTRLGSLEVLINPDRPSIIFIMPYLASTERLSGINATLKGRDYYVSGDTIQKLLKDAQSLIEASDTSSCELVCVTVLH